MDEWKKQMLNLIAILLALVTIVLAPLVAIPCYAMALKWYHDRKNEKKLAAEQREQRQRAWEKQQQQSASTKARPPTPAAEPRTQQDLHQHDPAPLHHEQDHAALDVFISSMVPGRCAGCLQPMGLNADNVTRSVQRWWNEIDVQAAVTERKELACGTSSMNHSPLAKIRVSAITVTINHCCPSGKDLVLWALACATSQFKPLSTQWILPSNTFEIGSMANARGTGYGTHGSIPEMLGLKSGKGRPATKKAGPSDTRAQEKETKTLELRFRLMASLLPSLVIDPSKIRLLEFMITRSDLLSYAADLLDNDSIEEIQKQYHLYDGLLDFIEALSSNARLAHLVTQGRPVFDTRGQLSRLSFVSYRNVGSDVAAKRLGKSLSTMLVNILPQSETMLQYAKTYNLDGSENANMKSWNARLIKIAQPYRGKPVAPVKRVAFLPTPASARPVQSFAEYHRENRMAEIPDHELLRNHIFKSRAERLVSRTVSPQRMKRVVRELTILQTSLPEGIFVRHGASRPDVLKVLIIGPQDTPYADGFFLFDVFLPADFPQVPPEFRLRVTPDAGKNKLFSIIANGFNPNLYRDGTVCLSLLGTWSGEPWRPEQSTLLQVLVSIQSMIFCAEPWYNEPGRDSRKDERSAKYNETVRRMTVNDAIDPWVQNKTTNANYDGLWKEVADKYFGKDSKYKK
ncbi:ubiquitin-conjugating enzyme protein 17 [Apiospora arundinis]